jgi:hypothetical protein
MAAVSTFIPCPVFFAHFAVKEFDLSANQASFKPQSSPRKSAKGYKGLLH